MELFNLIADASDTVIPTLSNTVTSAMIEGVFDEIYALLPTVLPAVVGFLAVRKGISFLLGSLRRA